MSLISSSKSSETNLSKAQRTYERLRELVNHGNYEQAAEYLRALRNAQKNENPFDSVVLKLISGRISLRSGQEAVNLSLIHPDSVPVPFFKAELHLLRGYYFFNLRQYKEGALEFQKASELYKDLELGHRQLTAEYNVMIGLENAKQLSHFELLKQLNGLEEAASELPDFKMLGLVKRQRSYLYGEEEKWTLALDEIEASQSLLLKHGTKADFDLTICQEALCLYYLKKCSQATKALEKVLTPIDSRVQFPLSLLKTILAGDELKESRFDITSTYWRERYNEFKRQKSPEPPLIDYLWDRSTSQLRSASGLSLQIKPKSLEGRLIHLLVSHKELSKAILCEQLWPEFCDSEQLDNRLHRLISRMNKKIKNLIQFDGQKYFLTQKIFIKIH
ncbi:MAG: hypothetical protein KDD61_16440 [Bdellovibrionales bacterium]|nr:hypothetical protein [Bdellovibrionales bacterium]